jgi:NAD(P)-dependent dehydrogenase (short-subunit alcohol dehydrogenase family)
MPSAAGTQHWNVYRLPRAEGKNSLITGGNAGIEYFVAAQLASTGATVILGSRDTAKADAARTSIRSRVPGAHARHLRSISSTFPRSNPPWAHWRWTASTRSCATPVRCSTHRSRVRPQTAMS